MSFQLHLHHHGQQPQQRQAWEQLLNQRLRHQLICRPWTTVQMSATQLFRRPRHFQHQRRVKNCCDESCMLHESLATERSRQQLGALKLSTGASAKRPRLSGFNKVTDIVKAASEYLGGDCLTLFEKQLHFSQVAPKGRRYSTDAKLLALSLHSHGPQAYRFLSQMFALPSRSTLSVWLQSLPVMPGFCQDVIQALSCKVQCLTPKDRVCVLMIDETFPGLRPLQ